MPARVQIEIEAKDSASGVLRAVASSFGNIGKAGSDFFTMLSTKQDALDMFNRAMTDTSISVQDVANAENMAAAATARFAETLATMAIEGLKDSIEFTQEYAGAVRDLALASGASAEEASRLLQVLDDYEISAENVTQATRAMTRNGLAPTVETLASLSDQYLALNTAQEKNAFVIENLGRGGLEWVNVLNQGGEAILALNNGINQNLILTDEQIRKTEEFRLAQDAFNDNIDGMKVSLGLGVMELVNTNFQMERLRDLAIELGATGGMEASKFAASIISMSHNADSAAQSYTAMAQAIEQSSSVVGQMVEETALPQIDYKSLIGDIQNFQNEQDRYSQTNEKLLAQESELLLRRDELIRQLDEMTEWQKKYSQEGKDAQAELEGIPLALQANADALAANAEAHKRWAAETVYAFAVARASADGSISEVEGELLIGAGEALGLFSEETATAMKEVNTAFSELDTEDAVSVVDTLTQALQTLTQNPWTITIDVNAPELPASSSSSPSSPVANQSGGVVYAGQPYMVGEAGAEPFFPEHNGRILGHAESLHALTLGAGGGTSYFYGNVTIELSGSNSGIMGLR